MNLDQFTNQMDRLKRTYGEKPYPPERVKILWSEMQRMDAEWFQFTVTGAISKLERAPLVNYFLEEASHERERTWKIEKQKNASEAKEFMSAFSGEDVQTICQSIRDRIHGRMNDEAFGAFTRMLGTMDVGCRCGGSGIWIVEDGGAGTVYRCRCRAGQARRENYPMAPN